ncbi:MAG TPA: CpaD family pilus assembly lipoprotein, partial [Magnetovibrio sp.]
TCGNWQENQAFNPTNNPQPDFGCSNRRNLGLTVADPGDLIDAQPMSGRGAARRDKALDSYNAGEPIGPQQAPTSTQNVSGAAQ